MQKIINMFTLKKDKKVAIITIGIIISIACLFTVVYTLVSKKTPKEFYIKAEEENFKKYSNHIKKVYDDFYKEQIPFIENKYQKKLDISVQDINVQGDKFSSINNLIIPIAKKLSLMFDYNNNVKDSQSLSTISVSLSKSRFVDAYIYSEADNTKCFIPVLVPDKHYLVNNESVDKIYSQLNIPIRPKRVLGPVDIVKTLKYSDDVFNKVMKAYGILISNFIDERDVTYGLKKTVKIGQDSIDCQEVIIVLNSKKTENLLKDVIKKIASDDDLIRLTYENYADIIKLVNEAGIFDIFSALNKYGIIKLSNSMSDLIDTINVKKDTGAFKDFIKLFSENVVVPNDISMKLLIDKSYNIVDRQININNVNMPNLSSKNKYSININTGTNDIKDENFNTMRFNLIFDLTNRAGDNDTQKVSFNSEYANMLGNILKSKIIKVEYEHRSNDIPKLLASLNLELADNDVDLDKDKNATLVSDINYKLSFSKDDSNNINTLKGNINSETRRNDKMKTENNLITLNINLKAPSIDLKSASAILSINRYNKLNVDFGDSDVVVGTPVDTKNMNGNGINQVCDEINKSIHEFIIKNVSIIGESFLRG